MAVLTRLYARDTSETKSDWSYFKIGEGGRIGTTPKVPDVTYTDLESEGTAITLPPGGVVTWTTGSPNVGGALLDFTTMGLSVGQWIKPGALASAAYGSSGTPGTEYDVWGEIQSISSTNIVLTSGYGGASVSGRPLRVADEPLYTFRKALTNADVLWIGAGPPSNTEVTCIVSSSEANADQLGNNPEFFELGVFDADGVMVIYMTFDQQTKVLGVQLNNIIDVLG